MFLWEHFAVWETTASPAKERQPNTFRGSVPAGTFHQLIVVEWLWGANLRSVPAGTLWKTRGLDVEILNIN